MDIQKKPEFTETINLVKAVLGRLEFHAFEEVLIWSEEHASKALLRCLKKTLSEFENGHLVLTSSYPKLKHFSIDTVTSGLMTALDQAQERQDNLNREIDELKDQLAKAQSVPYEPGSFKSSHEIIINETKSELIDGYDIAKEDEYLLESLVYRGVCIGKAQAVPEGFIAVPKDDLMTILGNCSDSMDGESTSSVYNKTGKPSTWFDYYIDAEKRILAVIEAQEPAND